MRVVFFTGAGISRESGLPTFRDADGLWEGRSVEDVCSVRAWAENPGRVLDFYNERRRAARMALPNAAHDAIAALELSGHEVSVVTQNIDDLHERAGSRNVLHLHGEIARSRSVLDDATLYDCPGDLHVGDHAPDGGQLRPHVVFFGEPVYNYATARSLCKRAEVIFIVGTTLAVYPAAYLVEGSTARTVYVINPDSPRTTRLAWEGRRIHTIRATATVGVPEAIARMIGHHDRPA